MDLTDPTVQMGLGLALAAVALAALLAWRSRNRPAARAAAERRSLDTLMAWQPQATRVMTSAERQAWRILSRAYPGHVILAQVPLARFLRVPTRHSYSEWLRRIGSQCADLVVCDAESQVLAVVAVRGTDAQSERALRRHSRMARVLSAAQIPLHLWSTEAMPTAEGARRALGLALLPGEPASAEDEAQSTPQRETLRSSSEAVPQPDQVLEMREPPNSTWFDDLDSGRTPLDAPNPPESTRR